MQRVWVIFFCKNVLYQFTVTTAIDVLLTETLDFAVSAVLPHATGIFVTVAASNFVHLSITTAECAAASSVARLF